MAKAKSEDVRKTAARPREEGGARGAGPAATEKGAPTRPVPATTQYAVTIDNRLGAPTRIEKIDEETGDRKELTLSEYAALIFAGPAAAASTSGGSQTMDPNTLAYYQGAADAAMSGATAGGFADGAGGFFDSAGGYFDAFGGYSDPSGGYFDAAGGYSDPYGGYADAYGGYSDPTGGYFDASGGYSDPYGGYTDATGGYADPYGGYADPYGGYADAYGGYSDPYGGYTDAYGNYTSPF